MATEETRKEIKELLDSISETKKNGLSMSILTANKMFKLYNSVTGSSEFNTGCPSCRNRVETNLRNWYETNK